MKNFSLPRLAIVMWFLFFTVGSLWSYLFLNVRHEISFSIFNSAVWTAVILMAWGWIEEKF